MCHSEENVHTRQSQNNSRPYQEYLPPFSAVFLLASCANPRTPRNGRRIGDDYTHGHAVRFVCAPNYKLEGDSLISCSDGKWSGPTPLCRGQ